MRYDCSDGSYFQVHFVYFALYTLLCFVYFPRIVCFGCIDRAASDPSVLKHSKNIRARKVVSQAAGASLQAAGASSQAMEVSWQAARVRSEVAETSTQVEGHSLADVDKHVGRGKGVEQVYPLPEPASS